MTKGGLSVSNLPPFGGRSVAHGAERMASEWRAGPRRTIRHPSARSEFVRTLADSGHLERVDDPARTGTHNPWVVGSSPTRPTEVGHPTRLMTCGFSSARLRLRSRSINRFS